MSTKEVDELLNRQDEKGWQLISHCITDADDATVYMPNHYFIFFYLQSK